ncbi:MAG TPA: hypothetical protein VL127_12290 [Bryobacteraceae bacterium]|jgi:hypothetical protein|nr:hypothetical protein [Bryobacteraceae bacterium]
MIRVNATAFLIVPLLISAANPPVDRAGEIPKLRLGSSETSPPLSAFWRKPTDIRTRDLFYGAGGKENQPVGPFVFQKEDQDGTSPKFSVRDVKGVEWKVKLGVEARPETAASRLVWAAGYYVDEDYFLPYLKVEKMQRLHRGQHQVSPDGSMQNVRLKREHKKLGEWKWRHDPFEGTREWNGLRVLMCLINNWDLKDTNTAIRVIQGQRVYLISDLGASFGAGGWRLRVRDSKGNLQKYESSRFITNMTPEFVTFGVPSRPELFHHFMWIGKRISRADAQWIGKLLGNLSSVQIESAFRAAGYQSTEAARFSAVVEERIAELERL